MMEAMLKIENLYSGYGKMEVLHGVSMEVRKGEIVALLGPNGAGKTTLLNSVFGIARVFKGSVMFSGENIVGRSPYKLVRMGIGYSPQLNNIFPNLSVVENLLMGAFIRRKDLSVKESIDEIFQLFPEIERRKNQKAKTLSGGERQMLAVARALMAKPKLIMLDEPTAGLAPKAATTLINKISEMRDMGITILLVEQNIRRALEIADRAYVLSSGEIIRVAESEELLKEDVEKLFFRQS